VVGWGSAKEDLPYIISHFSFVIEKAEQTTLPNLEECNLDPKDSILNGNDK